MSERKHKILTVIGGGAGGFFAAIQAKSLNPNLEVRILEKSNKFLSKVKISGGGRCNVTNIEPELKTLSEAYPRGSKQMRKWLGHFSNKDMIAWLESKGVPLKLYDEGCLFPEANDSQVIIDLFHSECDRLGIKRHLQQAFQTFKELPNGAYEITVTNQTWHTDYIILSLGGLPKLSQWDWARELGYEIKTPLPSLFTFNMPTEDTASIMGLVVENAKTAIVGAKFAANGPLLFTHWGMSGPAIIQLSAYAARDLAEKDYQFQVRVSWLNEASETEIRNIIAHKTQTEGGQKISNKNPFHLPNRLWEYLLNRKQFNTQLLWSDIQGKSLNKMVEMLRNDIYKVEGKTTFKEEFVTSGGIDMSNLNAKTLESKLHPGVYFIGEMIDLDGKTGGYNFQGAWTTAFIVAKALVEK